MKKWKLREVAQLLGTSLQTDLDIQNICTDTRELRPGDLFIALVGDTYDGHDYVEMALGKGAVACVCSRPLDVSGRKPLLLVKDTKAALMALAAAYRKRFDVNVVGITGSVGKTTTKDMIAQALSADCNLVKTQGNLNNEIGLPKTLFSIEDENEVAVVEMGMSDLGEISLLSKCARPDISVITNIGVSHIETLGTRENILKAKLEIVEGMPPGSPLILNYDNDLLAKVDQYMGHRIISYGINNPDAEIQALEINEDLEALETSFQVRDGEETVWCKIPCIGQHNILSALAAYCVVRELGLDRRKCLLALHGYKPTGMRQNIVKKKGITFIEDCYNASPDSMAAALETLSKLEAGRGAKKVAVLGDMLELGPMSKEAHRQVGRMLASCGIDTLLACGSASYYIVDGAEKSGFMNTFFSNSKDEVTKRLLSVVRDGDVLLFKASRGIGLEEIVHTVYASLDK